MYTSHRFNPKTSESHTTIGDPFDKPKVPQSRHKSRQFQTNPPKLGQTSGYFTSISYTPDTYQDTNAYRVAQPRQDRRLGFGSLDASKRDEFTLDIRAQQYKELLDSEIYFQKKYADENDRRRPISRPDQYTDGTETTDLEFQLRRESEVSPTLFQNQVPELLYDIGKDGGTTPICNKCAREVFYCKHRVETRRQGPYNVSSQNVGEQMQYGLPLKPLYGRKSQIKDFYDNNHLGVQE